MQVMINSQYDFLVKMSCYCWRIRREDWRVLV